MNIVDLRMMRWMCGKSEKAKVRNWYVSEAVSFGSSEGKLKKIGMAWCRTQICKEALARIVA